MACFLVAAAVGVVTLAIGHKIPEKYHIGWLNTMIWGSVLALLVEHVWHGEIVPWFPFLTAAADPGDATAMLSEMAVIGVPMMLTAVLLWACAVVVANRWAQPAGAPQAGAGAS